MYRDESAAELAARIGTDDEPFLLDVRSPEEFEEWRIPGAVNIPVTELAARAGEVPRDREVVTLCASGNRSSAAADFLSHNGWKVANLRGGMAAWGTVYDWVTLDFDEARVVQVRRRGKGCLSYVVGSGREAAVIDPTLDLAVYREIAAEHDWTIAHVFDTHLHADHLSGARALAESSGAVLHLNPADAFHFEFTPLRDGDAIALEGGATLTVAALHTPGHTLGSTIYFIGDRAVLTGDTLFVESVGRPDLAERAEEFARNLHRSLEEKVLVLPDDALVLPGHYGDAVPVRPDEPVSARLGDLRRTLEPLQLDEEEFVHWATSRTTPRPPSYVEIVKANMGQAETPVAVLQQMELGPNRCSA
ncbi:MAG TPA: rhodanese-like domain-containing protein [Acidimicrobiales bacterium]|nr:rhodanese-like domain-containing protein [Acidimicrobiales bacterium]